MTHDFFQPYKTYFVVFKVEKIYNNNKKPSKVSIKMFVLKFYLN